MKKKSVVLAILLLASSSIFAYNPPVGGENVLTFTNPDLLMGGDSAVGGAYLSVVPLSIAFNPALTAYEQRVMLNVSYSAMINGNKVSDADSVYGQGFQVGVIVPTKWGVFTGVGSGTFASFEHMDIGNSLLFRFGASKEIIENRLAFGANIYSGFYFSHGNDFTIGVDLGGIYEMDDIGFLKAPRIGVSLLNLGKPLTGGYAVTGIDGTTNDVSFPGILTPRVAFGAELFNVDIFGGAFSADLSFPTFQNVVFDVNLAFSWGDLVTLNIGWDANVRELASGATVSWPSVGLAFKLAINSSQIAKANKDWAQSEIVPSVAWQNVYGGIHVISAGAKLDLGMVDTSAPEIILVFDDGEEVGNDADEAAAYKQWEEQKAAEEKAERERKAAEEREAKKRAEAEAKAAAAAQQNGDAAVEGEEGSAEDAESSQPEENEAEE